MNVLLPLPSKGLRSIVISRWVISFNQQQNNSLIKIELMFYYSYLTFHKTKVAFLIKYQKFHKYIFFIFHITCLCLQNVFFMKDDSLEISRKRREGENQLAYCSAPMQACKAMAKENQIWFERIKKLPPKFPYFRK